MPPNPAQKVPQVGHRDPPGPHSRDVNSCPRERQGGYKQIPPDLPGGYRPPGRLLLQLQRLSSVAGFRLTPKGRWCCMYVCVCVCFFPFILDIKFVGRTSRGHTGGRPHRIFHPPSFCGACLNFSREKDSAIPFPRRPRSRILCTNDFNRSPPVGHFYFCFLFF